MAATVSRKTFVNLSPLLQQRHLVVAFFCRASEGNSISCTGSAEESKGEKNTRSRSVNLLKKGIIFWILIAVECQGSGMRIRAPLKTDRRYSYQMRSDDPVARTTVVCRRWWHNRPCPCRSFCLCSRCRRSCIHPDPYMSFVLCTRVYPSVRLAPEWPCLAYSECRPRRNARRKTQLGDRRLRHRLSLFWMV
jgi:hypothetical protein